MARLVIHTVSLAWILTYCIKPGYSETGIDPSKFTSVFLYAIIVGRNNQPVVPCIACGEKRFIFGPLRYIHCVNALCPLHSFGAVEQSNIRLERARLLS